MKTKIKPLYPGTREAERERGRKKALDETAPDFIGGAPNYDKFEGYTPEQVLVWLNID